MNRVILLALLPLAFSLAMWGCDNDTSNDLAGPGGGTPSTDMTCLGCHQNEDMLKASLPAVAGSEVPVPNKGDG